MDKLEQQLAKLQADIQIWLTTCFTLIVLMATCALGAWQIIATPTADLPQVLVPTRLPIFYCLGIAGLVSGIGTLYSFIKMKECRNLIVDLVGE